MTPRCSPPPAQSNGVAAVKALLASLGLVLLTLTAGAAYGQTLLSQTTWGGPGPLRANAAAHE